MVKKVSTEVTFAHHEKVHRSCLSYVEEYLKVAEELEQASNN